MPKVKEFCYFIWVFSFPRWSIGTMQEPTHYKKCKPENEDQERLQILVTLPINQHAEGVPQL
jgi:hypothetical protein